MDAGMTNVTNPIPSPDPADEMAERKRIIAARNRVLGLVLLFFVLLFFAITLVKMKI
jgi:hypothetical protein